MKIREKPYSLEEDLSLDLKNSDDIALMRPYLIEKLEEYDPGGKRAHEIAKKFQATVPIKIYKK